MEYNDGKWTEARFRSFIKGTLRHATMRWPPKIQCKRNAWIKRGVYRCAGYKRRAHQVPVSLPAPPGKKSRINNIFVDHIVPIIDPEKGWESWDETISRMFCNIDNLQVLCRACHDKKTKEEKEKRT